MTRTPVKAPIARQIAEYLADTPEQVELFTAQFTRFSVVALKTLQSILTSPLPPGTPTGQVEKAYGSH